MSLRANAFLAVFCLAAAICAGPVSAGPQGPEPVGVGDVPADSHLPTSEPAAAEQPAATAADPTPAPVTKKKVKKGKSAEASSPSDASGTGDSGAAAPAADGQGSSAVIVALRQTGYTLVVRHAEPSATSPDKASADPENEKLERQLDSTGRQQAKMLGVAYRALDVPIGEILSSPAYYALETVKIARVGDPIIEPELDEGGQGTAVPASTGGESTGSTAWLKAAVAKPPRRGTNRLIMTHLPLIIAAFGKDYANVAPGETLVLKPDGEGDATVIGRLKIEDLKQLAGK